MTSGPLRHIHLMELAKEGGKAEGTGVAKWVGAWGLILHFALICESMDGLGEGVSLTGGLSLVCWAWFLCCNWVEGTLALPEEERICKGS